MAGCLDSVAEHGYGLAEVIVVDNASTDRTADIAARYPGVVVVREDTKGLTHARQAGLNKARGDIIAYMDADTRMPPGWVAQIKDFFAAHEDAVALSGPARYWDATPVQRAALGLSWWLSAPLMYRLVGYMIYGAHFAARASALRAIGGFNRDIAFYGEDTDVARRLSKEGKVVFRMDFYILSSARRFAAEGLVRTNLTYSLNFLWPALFGRPFSYHYRDIRSVVPRDRHQLRALAATAAFSLAGLYGAAQATSALMLPHTVFYAVLVVNTYFSIRFFAPRTPDSIPQTMLDGGLAALYLALGFAIGRAGTFEFFALLLFMLATAKYVEMRRALPPAVYKRKIVIDLLGITLCAAALLGSSLGYAAFSAWAFAAVFLLANVYLLWVRPMYRE